MIKINLKFKREKSPKEILGQNSWFASEMFSQLDLTISPLTFKTNKHFEILINGKRLGF